MNKLRTIGVLLLATVVVFAATGSVRAGPPVLPSSFWGEIHITDGSPSAGDQVLAYIDGVSGTVGTATIIWYPDTSGNLVYSMDVRGDDEGTPQKEGGVENDVISFYIGTRLVMTGVWHSGTNVNRNIHPPDAALTYSSPAYEGSPVTLDASGSTDWGSDKDTYAFDCDGIVGYEIGPQAGATVECTFADNSIYTVGVKVVDLQKGESTETTTVTVLNVAPTATFGNNGPVNEGSNIILTLTGASDPSPVDMAAGFTYAFDCGSGYGAFDSSNSTTCPTTDKGTRTVKGQIKDKDGGVSEYTANVTINDVLPLAEAGGPYPGTAGQPVHLVGTPTCVPVDGCTVEWLWNGNTIGTADAIDYIWNTVGDYTVTFRVHDNDGNVVPDTATVNIGGATHSITLLPGWNLVSFNLIPVNPDIAAVLSSIVGKYGLVYAWDATVSNDNWQHYDPNAAFGNTLSTLDNTRGFWIKMNSAGILNVEGSVPQTTSVVLSTTGGGWNLVGYPAANNRDLPGAFSGISFSLVYAYHANDTTDPWKLFDEGAPSWSNDLTAMSPGWGYWVKVSAGGTWDVSYP